MTPAQALTLVRSQLNETAANFWTDAEIYAYMWEAENQLAQECGYTQAVTTHTTVTDQSAYTAPDDCLKIARVTFDGKKLKKVTAEDIDRLDGTTVGSTIQSGKPTVYKEWGQNITLYKTPDDTYGAEPLYFEFYKAPAVISGATDFTISNVAAQQLIPEYCLWRCKSKDKDKSAADHYQVWKAGIESAKVGKIDEEFWDEQVRVRDEDDYPGDVLGID